MKLIHLEYPKKKQPATLCYVSIEKAFDKIECPLMQEVMKAP